MFVIERWTVVFEVINIFCFQLMLKKNSLQVILCWWTYFTPKIMASIKEVTVCKEYFASVKKNAPAARR